jgi:hypothetical protein
VNAKHSSASALWYTPADVIERARTVLGSIELDPASDERANETVRAECFIGADGEFWQTWPHHRRVWLNPPGGKAVDNRSQAAVFWRALTDYREAGLLRHALFLAFSIEALQTTQSFARPIMSFPFCVPDKRIRFVSPFGEKSSPTHANAIVYVPGTEDVTDRFLDVFSSLGACKR